MITFLISLAIGGLHALRGSGFFSKHIKTSTPVKWGLMPILLAYSAYLCGAPVWLAFLFILPYAGKMATGTGGDMQARVDNAIPETFNPHEMRPFDDIANIAANGFTFGIWKVTPFEKGKIRDHLAEHTLKLGAKWHQAWGFTYCLLWGAVFTIPFIFTNYALALPLLLYPALVRYESNWRVVEFTLMFWYAFLFITSLGA